MLHLPSRSASALFDPEDPPKQRQQRARGFDYNDLHTPFSFRHLFGISICRSGAFARGGMVFFAAFAQKKKCRPERSSTSKKPHRAVYRIFRNPACGKAAPYPPLYCSQRPRYANIDVFSGRSANHVGICFGFLYSIVGFNTRYHALSRKQITITWSRRRSRSPESEYRQNNRQHRRTRHHRRW